MWSLPFLIALCGYLFAERQVAVPVAGDGPHYALETFSVALDGDRDLTNDYASLERVTRATEGGVSLQPQAVRQEPGAPLISIHGPGTAVLLAPAALIGGTVHALRIEMIVIAAVGAQLLFLILAAIGRGSALLRWAVWAAVVFSLPILGYSGQLYPEMPAAVVVLGVVRILLVARLRSPHVLGVAILAASLPWLHARFAIVSVALGVALIVRLLQTRGGRLQAVVAPLALAAVPVVASVALMSVASHDWYGSYSPVAQLRLTELRPTAPLVVAPAPAASTGRPERSSGGQEVQTPKVSVDLLDTVSVGPIFSGVTRSLLSSRNGWIPFAPVGILGLAAAIALALRRRWWVAYGTLAALAYVAQIASAGVLPGTTLPGRFEIVFLPLVAVPLLMVLDAVPWSRWLFFPLAVAGAAIGAFGITHAAGLVPLTPGKERADIGAGTVLLRPWPTVSREPVTHAARFPIDVCASRGRGATCSNGEAKRAGLAGAGVLVDGRRKLPAGDYTLIAELAREPGPATEQPAARIDVRVDGRPFVQQIVNSAELPIGQPRAFTEDLRLGAEQTVRVRVVSTGAVGMRVGRLSSDSTADPATGLVTDGKSAPDRAAVLAWLALLAGLVAALTVALRRADRARALT